jgi:hypothetical protein
VTVVLDHRTGSMLRLNAAAGCVWDVLAGPQDLAAVADRLASRFALAPTRARRDALAALEELEREGFVTRRPQRGGDPGARATPS